MPSEIMSLADAGVAGLGSAIDAMVSSGGTPLGSEIAQVDTLSSLGLATSRSLLRCSGFVKGLSHVTHA